MRMAVANHKGGVGKTTTAINLASCLVERGKRVLIIDTDFQGAATTGLGFDIDNLDYTLYDSMSDEAELLKPLQTNIPNLDLIPSNMDLSGTNLELTGEVGWEFVLKIHLDRLLENNHYDYVISDCPPSLDVLTVNALVASDAILIPLLPEPLALKGLTHLLRTLHMMKTRLDKDLQRYVLVTMYQKTTLHDTIIEAAREELHNPADGSFVFDTVIPRTIKVSEAYLESQPLSIYNPESTAGQAYKKLAEEVEHFG